MSPRVDNAATSEALNLQVGCRCYGLETHLQAIYSTIFTTSQLFV